MPAKRVRETTLSNTIAQKVKREGPAVLDRLRDRIDALERAGWVWAGEGVRAGPEDLK